jgi:hypothetical protein
MTNARIKIGESFPRPSNINPKIYESQSFQP